MSRVNYPLRVLHVDSADEYRGGQNQVRTLVAGLRRFPHVHQLVAAPVAAPLLPEVEALGVPVASFRWTSPADIRGMHGLARLLRHHWDVLHAHDSHALQLALVALGLTGAGTRVVASRRVSFPVRSPAVWRRADLVLAVSSSVRKGLLEKGLERRRVRVVHDGVDPVSRPCARPGALREALGMDGTRSLVGALGALDRQKDHATFLRAVAAAIRKGESEATYAVFGEGPERARLESAVADLGLEGRFLLPGHIPNAAASLGDLDVFVMCSTVEGLGSSALEAIAAGVPTVLTAGGGLTDVAGEIPVIPPGDDQSLADSLMLLLADPGARADRRAAGLARARSFTAARMVERTLQCYEVLARRPAESVN